jgi:3-oxoacyl-[acyl-carrier-protein] synthase II
LAKKAYIIGSGCISPQNTADANWYFETIAKPDGDHFKAIEPSYKEFINPNMLRRMGRAIKMGSTAANIALKESGLENVDGIMSGTGLGCFEDSEKFLLALLRNDEQFLTPTSFIQSTHNTVGSQIALGMKCHNYNFTYVHRGFSFECSVMDALLSLEEGKHSALVGGIEEHTPIFVDLNAHAGKLTTDASQKYFESTHTGIQMGEGATFFVLSDEKKNASASIDAISMLYKPESSNQILEKVNAFLKQNNTALENIDLILFGVSGDKDLDKHLDELIPTISKISATGYFKHLCGEYHTAGAFGTWLANKIIQKQSIPDAVKINSATKTSINKVLIINGYLNINYSFTLLSKC